MTSVWHLRNSKCKQIKSLEKIIAKKHNICGSTMFNSETIFDIDLENNLSLTFHEF